METLKVLNAREKRKLEEKIFEQFGYKFNLDYEVYINSKNKIFLIDKTVSKINTDELRVNNLGLYFGELQQDLRLSIEGSQLIGKNAKKNVQELSDDQARQWMAGEDLSVDSDTDAYVIVSHNGDFLGCGRVKNKRLVNYVPKERRVRI